ncbi:MAG: hypothetical protein KJ990_12380 [Proteobacteria bacterium]|nr:hypothetical protein [Pseudomonadota bacterium]MBU1647953.1 hypothetical protein [Pseudomonadota bacterium]
MKVKAYSSLTHRMMESKLRLLFFVLLAAFIPAVDLSRTEKRETKGFQEEENNQRENQLRAEQLETTYKMHLAETNWREKQKPVTRVQPDCVPSLTLFTQPDHIILVIRCLRQAG